jgi:hypothetical protein
LARLHARIANIRKDALHKATDDGEHAQGTRANRR